MIWKPWLDFRTDVLMKARIVSNLAQSAEEIVLILAIRLVILDRNAKKAYVKVRYEHLLFTRKIII